MRKNEKVMRFRSGEQVGQRFLVSVIHCFAALNLLMLNKLLLLSRGPFFLLVTGPSGRSARQTEI